MIRNIIIVCVLLVAGYGLLVFGIYHKQRDLLYYPHTQRILPQDTELTLVREHELKISGDRTLYSWHRDSLQNLPTLLYLHGNGGSVGTRVEPIRQLTDAGFGIYALGYPGYGGSDGEPSEAALMEAARAAYDHLRMQGLPEDRIVILGESLGTAVAVQLAAEKSPKAVVLLAPMYSVLERAQATYPFLPVRRLLKDTWLSADYIEQISSPLLVIHGTADRLIPIQSGFNLFDKAPEPKEFNGVKDAGHNNLYSYSIVTIIHRFVRDTMRPQRRPRPVAL